MDLECDLKRMFLMLNQRKIQEVIKRNGKRQAFQVEQIKNRIQKQMKNLNKEFIDLNLIIEKLIHGIYDGIETKILDNLAAEICAYQGFQHPDYQKLAARIIVSNLHKETQNCFFQTIKQLYEYQDKYGRNMSLIDQKVYQIVEKNKDFFNNLICYDRDYEFDYFGYKTLEKSYLLKINGKIVERPQQMFLRVSVGIHFDDLEQIKETYELMSQKWFIHATPTLFNSGTKNNQLSSCFLMQIKEDSIDGIFDTMKDCAIISKNAGGIGLSIHNVRAKNSYIKGTNGNSNGILPMLKVFNDIAKYVDQGGGRRKGSIAVYLEPWHADILDFLSLKRNNGKEENRARDLFYALWIPNLFMERVEEDKDWTLFCPNECPGLCEVYGKEFNELYENYEKSGRGKMTIKARLIWNEIIDSQIETGTPYMLYKDHCNEKSNQKNLGTIKSSNLCTEIVQFTSEKEIAVCNLASICLPKFVIDNQFDFEKLILVTKQVVKNLNKIIDNNFYPIKEAEFSNKNNRPIGIGVQGLADTFMKLKIDFESTEAEFLNEKIFETIYYAACQQSMELSKIYGKYSTFDGSPASFGLLQFDLWNFKPRNDYDWDTLKQQIKQHGLRNSLLVSPMPTASTSQILGNCESFEPFTSNLYVRRVLSGEFICLNQFLINELIELNLWNSKIKNTLIKNNGSVQQIEEIPQDLKNRYKTVWEISQKKLINLSAGRAPFICQSQSLNIYVQNPNLSNLSSIHFYTWKKGLKTGMYYLRSKPAANPIQFTVENEKQSIQKQEEKVKTCQQIQILEDGSEVCLGCGS